MTQVIQQSYTLQLPAIMAFPSLLEARKFKRAGKETGEAKFGASFVLDPTSPDLVEAKNYAAAAAKAKWPGLTSFADLKFPFQSGDKMIEERKAKLQKEGKEYDGKLDFVKGKVVIKAGSKFRPKLAILVGGKIVELDDDTIKQHASKFYFGTEALAQFNFVAYDKVNSDAKDGVTAYLQQVLTLNKGEKLSGGASAAEVFKGYAGQVSNVNPTGLDEEIPF